MATTTRTTPLQVVPEAQAASRTWIAPAVAAGIGVLAAAATTWWITAAGALEMTMRTAGM